MSRKGNLSRKTIVGIAAAMAIAMNFPAAPAAAESLLGMIFSGFRAPPPPPPPRFDSPGEFFRSLFDGNRHDQESIRGQGGVHSGYCVRMCDGRYFPIQAHRNISAAEQCRSFCPASETKVFSGAGIENASAGDGRRYADLPNAFAYRKRIVPGCSCNGRVAAGVAHYPVGDDPTLRPGDIVATNAGLTVYRGRDSRREASFTPIESAKISRRLRQTLVDVKVTPRLPTATVPPAASEPDQTSSIRGGSPLTVRDTITTASASR